MQTSTRDDKQHLLDQIAKCDEQMIDLEQHKVALANKLNQLGYKGK